ADSLRSDNAYSFGPAPPCGAGVLVGGRLFGAGSLRSDNAYSFGPAPPCGAGVLVGRRLFGADVLVRASQYPRSRAARSSTTGIDHWVRARRRSRLRPV